MNNVLTSKEISIASVLGFDNPIYSGKCPICGETVVTEENWDGDCTMYRCTNCLFYVDDFTSFEQSSGLNESDVKVLKEFLETHSWVDIDDYYSLSDSLIDCVYDDNYDLAIVILKYFSYMGVCYKPKLINYKSLSDELLENLEKGNKDFETIKSVIKFLTHMYANIVSF